GDRHGIDLVSVLIHHGDEPALPASAGHRLAVSELAREHYRFLTRRGVARQVHSFRIVEAFLLIGDVKVVTGHRVLASRGKARLRYTLSAAAANRPFASAARAGGVHADMPRIDEELASLHFDGLHSYI